MVGANPFACEGKLVASKEEFYETYTLFVQIVFLQFCTDTNREFNLSSCCNWNRYSWAGESA